MEKELKKFIGTKEVKAKPMTYGEFVKETGHTYEGHRDDEHGYMVEYKDGYRGWSPALPFQVAYRPAETFIDRMAIEKNDLRDRFVKIEAFIGTGKFLELSPIEQKLLELQLGTMRSYINILQTRFDIAVQGGPQRMCTPRVEGGIGFGCEPAPGCPEDPYAAPCDCCKSPSSTGSDNA